MMRLQKFMAHCGVGSRRKCEEIIQAGRVYLNGKKVTEMGILIDPKKDKVTLDSISGSPLKLQEEKAYILLNKPRGVITSAHDQFNRETVLDRIDWKGSRIYPVGRLDYDTEGLLILTNDGEFAFEMTHPKHQVEKEYHCVVKGTPSQEKLNQLIRGVDIGGFVTSPAKVKLYSKKENTSVIHIIIKEGKNRQVRRMFDAIGHPVVYLKRERLGNISLGSLKTGEWRRLTDSEVMKLKQLAGGENKND
jgi:23S rRNA pseudouridine2605 synthase